MNSTPQSEIIPLADTSTLDDRSTWVADAMRPGGPTSYTHPGIPGWEIRTHGARFRIYDHRHGFADFVVGAATFDEAIASIRYMHGE
jgi:hypothetical protein